MDKLFWRLSGYFSEHRKKVIVVMKTAAGGNLADAELREVLEHCFRFIDTSAANDFCNADAIAFLCNFIQPGLSDPEMGTDILCIYIFRQMFLDITVNLYRQVLMPQCGETLHAQVGGDSMHQIGGRGPEC